MTPSIRRSDDSRADRLASASLSAESFGYEAPTDPERIDPLSSDAQVTYLAERDDRIVGKARDRFYESWFGGNRVATCGVASVGVALEERGRGTMRALMLGVMEGARERGAVVSTLFPTVPGAYRRFGYETITTLDLVRLPTASLARVRPGVGSVRRGSPEDMAEVQRVYDTWAAAQNGPLTRTGPCFPDPGRVFSTHAVTLALDEAGVVVGYAIWKRTGGYHADGILDVADLVALTSDGYRLLLASLGSSYAVAPTTEVECSGTNGLDPMRLLIPDLAWPIAETEQYMLAILDVVGAFEARGYPKRLDLTVRFAVAGAPLPGVDGAYELAVKDGRGHCRRIDLDDSLPAFTPGGLALLFAGAHSCANVAMTGGLRAQENSPTDVLDSLFGGRQVHIRDTF